mmetsp:Transcript_54166/g.97601  ORF Transcript_54166/g.97601 Transcript_54166/m.97601 type:complete len:80 (-) Transcript_54166:506-745(-)
MAAVAVVEAAAATAAATAAAAAVVAAAAATANWHMVQAAGEAENVDAERGAADTQWYYKWSQEIGECWTCFGHGGPRSP